MFSSSFPLIIIGSGPAAFTAGIYAARAKISHIIISGDIKGGQLITSLEVENFPSYHIIGGYDLMQKFESHAAEFGSKIVNDTITAVDFTGETFVLTGNSDTYKALTVIVATGSSPKYLGLPKEEALVSKGVSYCATCDGNFYKDQIVAVVGGGNVAVEEALYLSKIAKKVFLIHRRNTLRAEQILQDKLLKQSNIKIIWDSVVTELIDNPLGLVGISIKNLKNATSTKLEITGLFIAIGHTPNTGFLEGALKLDENGYIITKGKTSKTSVPGIFAAGDVQDPIYRQAVTSAGSGCVAALDANMYLTLKSL